MSRAAFEAWVKEPPREFDTRRHSEKSAWPGHYHFYHVQCAWEAWQAAEKATVAACIDIINGHSVVDDRHEKMIADIRAEYPE